MKKKLLQVDFNTWHFLCNMKCQYCISHYDYKIEENSLLIRKNKSEEFMFYANIEHLFLRAIKVLEKLSEEYEVGILTFSGSEIFLFDGIFQLIDKADKMFSKVQLITNGLNINFDIIHKLKNLKNTHLTLSLDGNTIESNYSRTINNEEQLTRILRNLDSLIENKIPLNIYTVITKYNIDKLEEFFRFLENKQSGISVQLWPVFGSNNLKPSESQIISIEKVIKKYDGFNLRLQPKVYYKYLVNYLKAGVREIPCYLPQCSFYLKDNGNVKACLCNGIIDIGDIMLDSSEKIIENQQANQFYKDVLKCNCINMMPCNKCFINWDIINLYFCNKITINEIINIPIFNDEKIVKILKEYKESLTLINQ